MGVHFLGRTAIIATGLFAAGFRGKELAKGSVASALVLEAALLGWAFMTKPSELKTVPVDQEDQPGAGGPDQPLTFAPAAPPSGDKPAQSLVDPNWDITTWKPQ